MKRETVESSNVVSIGYDAESEILEVEFKPGKDGIPPIYQYAAVPQKIHDELMQAESVGKYLNANVKSHYHYERIS